MKISISKGLLYFGCSACLDFSPNTAVGVATFFVNVPSPSVRVKFAKTMQPLPKTGRWPSPFVIVMSVAEEGKGNPAVRRAAKMEISHLGTDCPLSAFATRNLVNV